MMTLYPEGEQVVEHVEALRCFDEDAGLSPKEIILGVKAYRALCKLALLYYNKRLPDRFTLGDLPVTLSRVSADPWRVDVRSAGVGE